MCTETLTPNFTLFSERVKYFKKWKEKIDRIVLALAGFFIEGQDACRC